MAADTNTPLLQLLLMGTGNDNNSWGQNLNDSVISLIEQAIAGQIVIGSTGGTITLTDDQSRNSTLIVQGALTSDLTIVVPTRSKRWTFYNDTDPTYSVLVKTAAQASGVNIPGRAATDCFVDIASNIVRRKDAKHVGEFFYHAGASVPPGAIACNGALPKRASFPDLYAAIGTTWGAGDGVTTFGLPNGQDTGRFLRSNSSFAAVGTYQASQNKAHTHTGSGSTGTESTNHTHTGSGTTSAVSNDHTHTGSGTTSGFSNDHSHTGSGTTGDDSPDHAHSLGGGYTFNYQSGAVGQGWGPAATNTGGATARHAHAYSFGTSGQNANHTHTYSFTTSGISANHTHTFSFTTSLQTANHTHTFSFTTSSDGGTEARPEALVGILCVRY